MVAVPTPPPIQPHCSVANISATDGYSVNVYATDIPATDIPATDVSAKVPSADDLFAP